MRGLSITSSSTIPKRGKPYNPDGTRDLRYDTSPLDADGNGPRNYRYAENGIDLLANVTLNINPLDIVALDQKGKGTVINRWNNFISYVRGRNIDLNDPKFNSDSRTDELQKILDEYNTGKPEITKITSEVITKAQEYHKLTYPKVVIDGRLGTQTFQLLYPDTIIHFNDGYKRDEISGRSVYQRNIVPPDKYLPVSWGNKKYVIKSSDFNKIQELQPVNKFEVIKKYDPVSYPNSEFYEGRDPAVRWPMWGRLDLAFQPIPTPSPEQINLATRKDQFKKEVTQKATDILNSLKS